ncbi:MAG: hypothetical protein OXJ62_09860, partial [Spirochaetaceae bacterium]|nr:hypothetical protein [Spirochaetaceae bacterium]
ASWQLYLAEYGSPGWLETISWAMGSGMQPTLIIEAGRPVDWLRLQVLQKVADLRLNRHVER